LPVPAPCAPAGCPLRPATAGPGSPGRAGSPAAALLPRPPRWLCLQRHDTARDKIIFACGPCRSVALQGRYGPKVRLDERKLKIARHLFDTHGPKVVFFGRFVSVLGTYAAFLAGTSKMRWRLFLPANAAGGILWAGAYTLAAYLAGNALQRLSGRIDLILGAAAVVAVVAVVLILRRQTGKLAARAEAAYPGPLQ
jgi:membrane protein DedA with SNARE-associated domain